MSAFRNLMLNAFLITLTNAWVYYVLGNKQNA
jgi:hypothetical protein